MCSHTIPIGKSGQLWSLKEYCDYLQGLGSFYKNPVSCYMLYWLVKQINYDQGKTKWGKLIISRGNYVIRETSPHRHALLLINQQCVFLYFNVSFQPLSVLNQIIKSIRTFSQFILKEFDTLSYLCYLLYQLDVWLIITGFHVRATGSFFQTGLSYTQWRILGCNVALQSF